MLCNFGNKVRCKLEIAYDGTDYCGWQRQLNAPTIQECLEVTFFKTFGHLVKIQAASRTDAGVHAAGQVALITYDNFGLSPEHLFKVWNDKLPSAILIKSFAQASPTFNPWEKVIAKIYSYDLFLQKPMPMSSRFGWLYPAISRLSWPDFLAYLQLFIGFHNFAAFSRKDPLTPKNPWRSLEAMKVVFDPVTNMPCENYFVEKLPEGFSTQEKPSNASTCRIMLQAKGFLHFQIRRMLGAALQYATMPNKNFWQKTKECLEGAKATPTDLPTFCAASKGLMLRKIFYDPAIYGDTSGGG